MNTDRLRKLRALLREVEATRNQLHSLVRRQDDHILRLHNLIQDERAEPRMAAPPARPHCPLCLCELPRSYKSCPMCVPLFPEVEA